MFDLVTSGVGKELTGDYSNQIASRGGFNPDANMNLAYFYENGDVYYLGYMHALSIHVQTSHLNIANMVYRGREKVDVECSLWQTRETVDNLQYITQKYLDHSLQAKDYKGTLIGYIDLVNGDQFRFLMPGFLFTRYEHRLTHVGKVIRTDLFGVPDLYHISNNSWTLIEEQKKIDYSTVKTINHL